MSVASTPSSEAPLFASKGPSAELQSSVTSLEDTIASASRSLVLRWNAGEIDIDDAEASLAALQPIIAELEASIGAFWKGADAASSAVLREVAAASLRLAISTTLQDRVDLDAGAVRDLYATLDSVVALQEADMVDGGLALSIIEEINERLTVESAMLVFGYLESRVTPLTRDLSPSRGKGLVLLRLLNDLLRRLSKPSRSHLVLSGRILSLLASVFPLGERSGVNLRGEFNVGNTTGVDEDEGEQLDAQEAQKIKDEGQDEKSDQEEEEPSDKDADPASIAARDTAFYRSFWSLQRAFANPTVLFEPHAEASSSRVGSEVPGTPATPYQAKPSEETQGKSSTASGNASPEHGTADGAGNSEQARDGDEEEGAADGDKPSEDGAASAPVSALEEFRNTTSRVLEVFAEASAREREMEQAERAAAKGGSSTIAAKKRKREEMLQNHVGQGVELAAKPSSTESTSRDQAADASTSSSDQDSVFPKYLTGRRVFEYQLRSPPFRRHVLLQYLILFQYLLSFNPTQKKRAQENWKNKQLLLAYPLAAEFTLSEDDEAWIRKVWREITALLEETGPKDEGRGVKQSVLQSLRREARWIAWKADNCPPIDRAPMGSAEIEASQTGMQREWLKARPSLVHSLGTRALSELWEDGLEPIIPGKRKTEDAEGMEVEIDTDGLEQLELPPGIPSVPSYAKMIKQQEGRAEMRRRKLGIGKTEGQEDDEETRAKREKLEKTDEELLLIEERKTSLSWRALRIARNDSLRLWNKIGAGDVEALLKAERDEKEQEKAAKEKIAEQAAAKEAAAKSATDTEAASALTETSAADEASQGQQQDQSSGEADLSEATAVAAHLAMPEVQGKAETVEEAMVPEEVLTPAPATTAAVADEPTSEDTTGEEQSKGEHDGKGDAGEPPNDTTGQGKQDEASAMAEGEPALGEAKASTTSGDKEAADRETESTAPADENVNADVEMAEANS
ncbi:unnamed protein product [Jaminaea pallidilutea]